MLRRRCCVVSKHEGVAPSFEMRAKDALLQNEVRVRGWKNYCSFGLIDHDTLTVTESVSSPCATGAAAAMPADILR
jgi:hypothetical protein